MSTLWFWQFMNSGGCYVLCAGVSINSNILETIWLPFIDSSWVNAELCFFDAGLKDRCFNAVDIRDINVSIISFNNCKSCSYKTPLIDRLG